MNTKTWSQMLVLLVVFVMVGTTAIAPVQAQNPAECEPTDRTEWEVYEGEGVTVQLPEADWEEVDLEAAAELGTEFMSDEMAVLAALGSQQGTVLALSSLVDPVLSVMVMVIPMPEEEVTIDNLSTLMGLDALEAFGMIISEPYIIDLESGEAYVLDVAFDETAIELPISIFERFYLVFGEENIYMVLFVTQEEEIKDLCGDVAAIANSFTFDESMAPEVVTVSDADWVTHTAEHVTISAPETWLDVSDPDFVETAIELAGESNPALEGVMNQFSPDLFEVFLLDPIEGVTVNIIAQDLGMAIPLDLMVSQMEAQYEQVLGATVIAIDTVEIPAGEALRAHITLDVNVVGGGSITQEQIQYILIVDTWLYVVSMGGPQTVFEEYEPVYDQIAESLEILN